MSKKHGWFVENNVPTGLLSTVKEINKFYLEERDMAVNPSKIPSDTGLVVDCPNIQLTQLEATSGEKIVYSGPGQFFQENNEKFKVKIFCESEVDWMHDMLKCNRLQQGKIIPDEELFSMRAYDMNGKMWESNSILPSLTSDVSGQNSIVTGDFNKVFLKEKRKNSDLENELKIFYKGKISVPINSRTEVKEYIGSEERGRSIRADVTLFAFSDFNFEIHVLEDWTVLYVKTRRSIEYDLLQRMNESFHLVMGITQDWSIAEIYNGDQYEKIQRVFPIDKTKTRVNAPLTLRTLSPEKHYWELFQKFYIYTSNQKTDDWHPIYELLYKVLESGKASLDVSILTATVAIEGVSKFFSYKNDNEKLKVEIKKVKEAINQCELSQKFGHRVDGMLSSMAQTRAVDKLYDLSEKGLIDKELVESWKRLRNKSAHSTSLDLSKIQTVLNDFYSVISLFYQLIFLIIGYQGKYTDYSTYRYPEKMFEGTLCLED